MFDLHSEDILESRNLTSNQEQNTNEQESPLLEERKSLSDELKRVKWASLH